MAGKYSRFKLFGSKVPKYLLPLACETILSIILKNYSTWVDPACIYLIANRNDQIFFPIVRSTLKNLSIPWSNLIYIDDTSSQLETALASSEILPTTEHTKPITFANIDTVIKDRQKFFEILSSCSEDMSCLDTFNGTNIQYSYAQVDKKGFVTGVADKKIISEFACSGLYGFGSYEYMHNLATSILSTSGSANFTRLYHEYILRNNQVLYTYTPQADKTIVLGTPEEYVINIHRFS